MQTGDEQWPQVFLRLSCQQRAGLSVQALHLQALQFHKKRPVLPDFSCLPWQMALFSRQAAQKTPSPYSPGRTTWNPQQPQPGRCLAMGRIGPWRTAWRRVSLGPLSGSYQGFRKWNTAEWTGMGNHQSMLSR